MIPDAVLISAPSVDFGTFLGLSQQALGRSPSASIDSCSKSLSDSERFLSCLAALRDAKAPLGLSPHLLTHVSFSVLVAADDRDMFDIVQIVAGMPFVVTETLIRGVQLSVITGNLNQWRDAVKSGSSALGEFNVRAFFNRVMNLFIGDGLNVWLDFKKTDLKDGTLFLTDAR